MVTMPPAAAGSGVRRLPLGPWEEWLRGIFGAELEDVLSCLRGEDEVMTPEALRAMPPTRLSFTNGLVRRMLDRGWSIGRRHLDIDRDGCGTAVYEIEAEGVTFHFGVFAHPPDEARQGRIREDEYDFFGAILEGPVDMERLARDHDAFTRSAWGARTTADTYGWTVANRSNRLFEHVAGELARGVQPTAAHLAANGGYLIRNAGYYGNGRAGTRAWRSLPDGHPLASPYHADVLSLFLWRIAGCDIVEATARARNPAAPALDPALTRGLGVGNSSGIGTVAALVRWPAWLSSYVLAREVALAHAISRPGPIDAKCTAHVLALLARAERLYREEPPRELLFEQPAAIAGALQRITAAVAELARSGLVGATAPRRPWGEIAAVAASTGCREACEQLHAILVEAHAETTDAVAALIPRGMAVERVVRPEQPVGELRALLDERFDWALAMDLSAPGAREFFWYRSEENGENRRGVRAQDPGAEGETFVDVAGIVQRLAQALAGVPAKVRVGRFLLEHPEHAFAVSRVQLAGRVPFGEIRANLLDAAFRPGDAIRFFLSVLGVERPGAASPQWVRGVFFQGAPLLDDLPGGGHDDWMFPHHAG
jgi:hypothetical protein